MKRQIPIVLLVFLCAQLSFAESIPDLADSDIFQPEVPAYQSGELIVRFADIEAGVQPPGGPIIVGPVRSRVIRDEISDFIVSGAVVKKELDGVAPGLAVVKLPEGTTVPQAFRTTLFLTSNGPLTIRAFPTEWDRQMPILTRMRRGTFRRATVILLWQYSTQAWTTLIQTWRVICG